MLYLRFNDERKRLMREMEESKLIIGSGNDSSRKKYVEKNSLEEIPENDEDDAGNASEEHDIYDNQSSKGSKSSKRNEENSNDDEDKKKSDDYSKNDSQSDNSKKSDSSKGKNKKEIASKIKKEDNEKPSLFNFVNPYDVDNYQKKNSLLDNNSHKDSGKNIQNLNSKMQFNEQSKLNNPYIQANFENTQKMNIENKSNFLNKAQEKSKSGQTISANNSSGEDSSFNNSSIKEANKNPNSNAKKHKNKNDSNYKEKEINLQNLKTQKSALSNLSHLEKKKSGDYESDKMSNVFKNITANPEIEPLSANDVNYMNVELSEHFEKKKNLINQTFLDKVEKIIAFLEENSIEFSNDPENNPLEMLKRLKNVEDVNERNQLIDKIEHIVAELFKNDKKDAN